MYKAEGQAITMSETPGPDTKQRRRMYDATAGLYAAVFPRLWRWGFPGVHRWLRDEFAGPRMQACTLRKCNAAGC